MSVLIVTGAAGWLGQNLVADVREGAVQAAAQPLLAGIDALRVLARDAEEAAALRALAPDAELVVGDVCDARTCTELCQGAAGGVLIHAAGVIHPKTTAGFRVNELGTTRVLAAARRAELARVVYLSSNSPLGLNPFPEHRFDEASPYRPYLGYGRSKQRAEQHTFAAHQPGRLETSIVRAPWFYGPRQPPRQTSFFELIRDGKAPTIGSGDNLRSMAYTGNLVQGLLLAAYRPEAAGRAWWIADERPYSWREVLETTRRVLEQELGRPCAESRLRLPALVGRIARAGDALLQAVGAYEQRLHVLGELDRTIACSVRAAQRELGYRPEVALEEGMRRSVRWLIEAGWS